MSRAFASFAALAAAGALQLTSSPADACGGCFVPPTESTVVTGHRMALSISPDQAVLWDQIRYSGDPADFSWVLPVKEGARIEIANDAFFEALDAATTTTVQAPPEGCRSPNGGGFGCGDSARFAGLSEDAAGASNNGVQVLHKGSVGPYDTVTLSSTDPNALESWLTENGYTIPDAIKPTLAAYVAEGFDFIALKLQPNQGVQQMKPVRVVSSSMQYALPLRMVAAGVGAEVEIVLYVIGEGRYQAANFENALVPPALVTWDFKTDQSDYGELRLAALANNEGRTWLTSYAVPGSLLAPINDPVLGPLFYNVAPDASGFGQVADTIAEAYFRQGLANQEGNPTDDCILQVEGFGDSADKIVDVCDETGESCGVPAAGEIDARRLACDTLDDLAVAMTGLHPRDVVLTRLEANLPVAALSDDLGLAASEDQTPVHSRFVAGLKLNACWDSQPASASLGGSGGDGNSAPLVLLALGAAGLYLASRRRTIT